MSERRVVNNYFVDEAGDITLFNRHGRVVIGKEGVSRTFMVGVLRLGNPMDAHTKLASLRHHLLADPYFSGVPSMQPKARKTAVCFHAKDDLPEVRREVFAILARLDAKVLVAIRRKDYLVKSARLFFQRGLRLSSNEIYDDLVKRLFKGCLHTAETNIITFAHRGKSSRQSALEDALSKARRNFEKKTGVKSNSNVEIRSAYPSQSTGLQVVDYYLWALQRLYERGEDRFFNLLKPSYRLIMDLDDTREKPYGRWYSDSDPLELAKIKPVAG